MARLAGKSARLYASITSGGTAEPIQFIENWSIDFSTDKFDVTSLRRRHGTVLHRCH
jgi:hypothetical protein